MKRGLAATTCLAVGVAVFGCQKKLPTAPSDLTEGLVIYEHINYGGQSAHVTANVSDLDDVKGPCWKTEGAPPYDSTTYIWDDCISSVKIAPGWEAHLYEHPGFKGWDQIVRDDIPDLRQVLGPCDGNLNDCVSSIRVVRR